MKRFTLLFALLLPLTVLRAQEELIEYAEDTSCGCQVVFVDGIQTTQEGEYYGFRRSDGKLIAPNKYKFVDKFHNGYCRVMLDYEQAGILSREGIEIVPCEYDEAYPPFDGLCLVKRGNLYGYCDTMGRLRLPLQYLAASSFKDGLAVVAIDIDSFFNAYGFIDTTGQMVIPATYQYCYPFYEGFAVVKNYDRYGLIDLQNRERLTFKYDMVSAVYKGTFFAGYDEGGVQLFDTTFHPISATYQTVIGRSPNRSLVVKDGKAGFIDDSGREVIPCQYDECGLFREGRAMVSIAGKWGIIDTLGRTILPIQFDNDLVRGEAYTYHDGWALIQLDGKYGYVDTVGNIIYPVYDDAYQYTDGLAPVKANGRWGYLDTGGNLFLPHVFDLASPFNWGRAEVFWHGRRFEIDSHGKCARLCNEAPATWTE